MDDGIDMTQLWPLLHDTVEKVTVEKDGQMGHYAVIGYD